MTKREQDSILNFDGPPPPCQDYSVAGRRDRVLPGFWRAELERQPADTDPDAQAAHRRALEWDEVADDLELAELHRRALASIRDSRTRRAADAERRRWRIGLGIASPLLVLGFIELARDFPL